MRDYSQSRFLYISNSGAIAALLLSLLMACGERAPSERSAEALLKSEAERCGEGLLEVESFRKTNGQTGEISGVRLYHMYFAAEVEFVTDAFAPKAYKPWCADEVTPFRRRMGDFVESGTIRSLTGRVTFADSERGWLFESLGDGAVVSERLSEVALRAAKVRLAQEQKELALAEESKALFYGSWQLTRWAPPGQDWTEPDWGDEVMRIHPGGRYEINGLPGSWSFDSQNRSLTLRAGSSQNTARIDGDRLLLRDRRGGRYTYVRLQN